MFFFFNAMPKKNMRESFSLSSFKTEDVDFSCCIFDVIPEHTFDLRL